METLLITLTFLVGLALGLGAMVHFARHDRFAGPGTGFQPRDEFGPLSHGRRPA